VVALAAWSFLSVVLLASSALRTAIQRTISNVRRAVTAPAKTASGLGAAGPAPSVPDPPTTIRIDGDLGDWPSTGVAREVAGDYNAYPEDRIPYVTSMFADASYLYLGWDFPDDSTDCRKGEGENDLTSVKFGLSGDEDAFMTDGLLNTCQAHPQYPDKAFLDGYQARWLKVDRDEAWDPYWGLRWRSVPLPEGINSTTTFASGHRVTEWAVPLRVLGAKPCETISIYVFSLHDWRGRVYGARSAGRPWIHDAASLSATVPCPTPCEERWSCTEWTVCRASGVQTRTCIDLNRCGGTQTKPGQLQPCTATSPSPVR